jgi:ABC-type transporter Mla maintaining outer membrane lipid asymmetry ATPase subunit MlaF
VALWAATRPEAMRLKLDSVRIALGSIVLVPALDLAVASGERVAVMGPSGCGNRRCSPTSQVRWTPRLPRRDA